MGPILATVRTTRLCYSGVDKLLGVVAKHAITSVRAIRTVEALWTWSFPRYLLILIRQ